MTKSDEVNDYMSQVSEFRSKVDEMLEAQASERDEMMTRFVESMRLLNKRHERSLRALLLTHPMPDTRTQPMKDFEVQRAADFARLFECVVRETGDKRNVLRRSDVRKQLVRISAEYLEVYELLDKYDLWDNRTSGSRCFLEYISSRAIHTAERSRIGTLVWGIEWLPDIAQWLSSHPGESYDNGKSC